MNFTINCINDTKILLKASSAQVHTYSLYMCQHISEFQPLTPPPWTVINKTLKNHKHQSPTSYTKPHDCTNVSAEFLFYQTCFALDSDMFFILLTHPVCRHTGLRLLRLDLLLLVRIKQNLAQFLHKHKRLTDLHQTIQEAPGPSDSIACKSVPLTKHS